MTGLQATPDAHNDQAVRCKRSEAQRSLHPNERLVMRYLHCTPEHDSFTEDEKFGTPHSSATRFSI